METTTAIWTVLGEMVTNTITWMGDLLEFIIGQPYVLIPMLVFFIGGGTIGLLTRLWKS